MNTATESTLGVYTFIVTSLIIIARNFLHESRENLNASSQQSDDFESKIANDTPERFAVDDKALAIERMLHETIPLSRSEHMNISALKFDVSSGSLTLSAPLAPTNFNVHGSGFAGSLHSICALTAWSSVSALLQDAANATEGLRGATLVIKSTTVSYRRPVTSARIVAASENIIVAWNIFCRELLEKRKADIDVNVHIFQDRVSKTTGLVEAVPAVDFVATCTGYFPNHI
jgi:thioesterase domain-containing protein